MSSKRDWLPARDAAARLDVKLTTLYSYTSRGLVKSVPAGVSRGRLYASSDVERLKARHDARSGHAAVAAGALRWGEPALETLISDIRDDGPYYRGISALSLLERAHSFECAAELAWTGVLPKRVRWPALGKSPRRAAPNKRSSLTSLAADVALLALHDRKRRDSDAAELARARWLMTWLAGTEPREAQERSIATRLLKALAGRSSAAAVARLDRALILCIDHELNASTFAARVAASAGSELLACIATGLHTLSGASHGGVTARVESLLDEVVRAKSAARVVRAYIARGELVPGFGHPLYVRGDPRCRALLALAEQGALGSARWAALRAVIEAMRKERQVEPNLDAGLVALRCTLGLRRGSASILFAIGRIAGFVAHILEQRAQGYLLRPRARYVGG